MSDRHGHHAKNTGAFPPVLRTTARRIPGTAVICRLEGEVDQDQKETLAHLAEAVQAGQPRLVIDLPGLALCDFASPALLQTRQDAKAAGQRLTLAAPSPALWRLLEITGTDGVLTICGSVRAALAATGTAPPG